ncbi:unnamed protein product [Prunus brigantina]
MSTPLAIAEGMLVAILTFGVLGVGAECRWGISKSVSCRGGGWAMLGIEVPEVGPSEATLESIEGNAVISLRAAGDRATYSRNGSSSPCRSMYSDQSGS